MQKVLDPDGAYLEFVKLEGEDAGFRVDLTAH